MAAGQDGLRQLHGEIDSRVAAIRAAHPDWLWGTGGDGGCRRLANRPQWTATEWQLLRQGLAALAPAVAGGMLGTIAFIENRFMATFLAFVALALLAGGCYFVYARSMATAAAADDGDLHRFMVANRELHLERIDHALWDTALQLAHGDEGVARARYIELRVQQMKGEAAAAAAASDPP